MTLLIGYVLSVTAIHSQKSQLDESSSELRFKHITVNDGLTNNKVNDITQDTNGYVWFGSDEGLNRYDGYEIKTYQHNIGDTTSISSNIVFSLFTDSKGKMWVGLRYGLDLYESDLDRFTHIRFKGRNLTNIRDFFEGPDGKIWVCAEEGLFYINPDEKVLNDFSETYYTLAKTPIHSFYIDTQGNKWIGSTAQGLSIIDTEGHHIPLKESSGFRIENILELDGNIWACTYNNGLLKYNPEDLSHKLITVNKNDPVTQRIRTMVSDREGNLWLGTRSGLYMKPNGVEKFLLMGHMDLKYATLLHNSVFSVYIDQFDIIWMGTFSGGVSYGDLNQKMFRSISQSRVSNEGLNDKGIFSIVEDKQKNLWFGTESGGVNFYNNRTGQYSYYLNDPEKDGIHGINIHAIAEDKNHKMWIGTYDAGLVHLNPKTNTFETFVKGEGACDLNSNHVYSILVDSKNVLWVGTDEGVCKFKDGCFECFEQGLLSKNGQTIISIFEDSSGRIWIGTIESGVFVYENGQIRHVLPELISRSISTIYQDSKGNIWFGGHENGLILFQEDTITRYTLDDGIPNSTVRGILEDDQMNLWFSTSAGLIRFTKGVENPAVARPDFRLYDVTNGLTSNQFTPASACKMENGLLYFGTIDGVTYFDPTEIRDNNIEPKCIITNLSVSNVPVKPNEEINGKVILTSDISKTESITLDHDDDYLTIEFSAIHYSNPGQHQYQYMLENYDEDWISTTSDKRYVTYTNLPGGNYTFRVRGTNYDGVWSSTDKTLGIVITPPWYQLAWVQGLFVLGIIGIIYGLVRIRINFLMQQRENLRLEVDRRTLKIKEQSREIEDQNVKLTQTIEQLQNAHMKLVESEKMSSLGQLTAGIAHEINNPANFIYGGVQGLEDDMERIREFVNGKMAIFNELKTKLENDPSEKTIKEVNQLINENIEPNGYDAASKNVDALMRVIKIGAERTVEIVKGLKAFSRIDDKDFFPADVHENIEDTLLLLNHKLKNRIEVVKNFAELPKVECNPGKINQVFMNLLSNAISAIRGNGTITITTSKLSEEHIQIIISDSGSGMPETVLRKIFDPFFTTKDIGEGTGLGLSISKGIIDEHKGKIRAESKEGEGTTFYIELPIFGEQS